MSSRALRRVTEVTRLPVLKVWHSTGQRWEFVTTDDAHGWFDKKSGEWGWHEQGWHYGICSTLFHRAIPAGIARIKMLVAPKLVTIQSLRHYRQILREQAHAQGYRPVGGIHARHSAIPMTPERVVVLEVQVTDERAPS